MILAKFQFLNISKNLLQRPQFQAKKAVPETLFLKTWAANTYPKFFWVPRAYIVLRKIEDGLFFNVNILWISLVNFTLKSAKC